nr:uncharacterized protein LOC131276176 isoform X2 [Dasypus novemcinctus]
MSTSCWGPVLRHGEPVAARRQQASLALVLDGVCVWGLVLLNAARSCAGQRMPRLAQGARHSEFHRQKSPSPWPWARSTEGRAGQAVPPRGSWAQPEAWRSVESRGLGPAARIASGQAWALSAAAKGHRRAMTAPPRCRREPWLPRLLPATSDAPLHEPISRLPPPGHAPCPSPVFALY